MKRIRSHRRRQLLPDRTLLPNNLHLKNNCSSPSNNSGNDRAALVRNLEAFLKETPDSHQRPQVYRALVEACLQLRDDARAAAYAERIVALSPDDISMTIQIGRASCRERV